MSGSLLNILLGVVASFVAWLVLTKVLRPRLDLDEQIEHVVREDGEDYYRVGYACPRFRRVEDVHVTVRLFRERSRVGAKAWVAAEVPVDESFRPVLGHTSLRKRLRRLARVEPRLVQKSRLFLGDIPKGSAIHGDKECPAITDLKGFLEATGGRLEYSVRCRDRFKGTYRTQSKTFSSKNIGSLRRLGTRAVDHVVDPFDSDTSTGA